MPLDQHSMPGNDQALPIEDYALIGDCTTAALVGRNGSIDWLCWPRFDGAACFGALLGHSENGRWLIAPAESLTGTKRHYHKGGMVLETLFETATGSVALIDFMVPDSANSQIVRIVEGRSGRVDMAMELVLRFDYGASVPWVTRLGPDGRGGEGLCMISGPEMAVLHTGVPFTGRDMRTVADFRVEAGERQCFALTHCASHLKPPEPIDPAAALAQTEAYWSTWSARCNYKGPYRDAVLRSLIILKALTFGATGGIVAAPTTSLPEQLGGNRNWDYRYCWLRDATLVLFSLMQAGYYEEAGAWRDWLHRSIAGSPSQIQIMYGLAGERRLEEWEVGWLPGYQGAAPVRIGNAASSQLQLDVYGEVTEALHQARNGGLAAASESWALQCGIIAHLETIWDQPDEGIWETRGGRQHFVYSKVMTWLAFDRMIKDAEEHQLDGPVEHWRTIRNMIAEAIYTHGFNPEKNSFRQHYATDEVDASLLLIPLVGFLPHDDPRVIGTTAAIEAELYKDGYVLRYSTAGGSDGLPPGEGAFLACSFWLVDNWHMQGRPDEAAALFEKLIGLSNDVGLLSEEYDPAAKRMTGNFPQAFSHTALIASAMNMVERGPAVVREAE